MKILFLLALVFAILIPQATSAGTLYGTVHSGRMPAASVEITVACPTFARPIQAPQRVMTDVRGSFAVRVTTTGRCEMRVGHGNQTGAPFAVFVSDNPVRYNFEIDNAMNRVR